MAQAASQAASGSVTGAPLTGGPRGAGSGESVSGSATLEMVLLAGGAALALGLFQFQRARRAGRAGRGGGLQKVAQDEAPSLFDEARAPRTATHSWQYTIHTTKHPRSRAPSLGALLTPTPCTPCVA